jgi:RNA polymerase sigma factor (sigma-70 family)
MIADLEQTTACAADAGWNDRVCALLSENSVMLKRLAARYALAFNVDAADLFQEGCIELVRAVADFRPELGFTFGTYAIRRAAKKMIGWAKNTGPMISPKSRSATDYQKRMITVDSLDQPMVNRYVNSELVYEESRVITLKTFLPDPSNPFEAVIAACDGALIREALATLSHRHQSVLIGRYWQGLKLQEIGLQWGCIRQNVEKIEKQAMAALRHAVLRLNRRTQRLAQS